jgi:hypothetical protein
MKPAAAQIDRAADMAGEIVISLELAEHARKNQAA